MIDKYILNAEGDAVSCEDLMTWAAWFKRASEPRTDGQCDRHVAVSLRGEPGNEHRISTVFLGINHRFVPGPPLLFETMIFGPDGNADDYQERYETRFEALIGHAIAVGLVEGLLEANTEHGAEVAAEES